MLFKELLIEYHDRFKPLMKEVFDLSLKNQSHSGDLLLVMENAKLTRDKDFFVYSIMMLSTL